MPQDKPIGIDLGTTNSAMAWVDEAGRSVMIPNAEGELITPSVVFFSESEVVVGKSARTAVTSHPDMVAQWVKRDMGAPFYSHPIRGRYLPPEVIQACILRKLKADITRAVGTQIRTVITVPAYFDEMRRKVTADAGEMAGLQVLDIVNEPTAAALAFGEALGYLSSTGTPQAELNVMVYDLGGGTFDATLLHLAPGKIQTLATDGDVQLGGHDWDKRLVDYAACAFQKAHGLDPREDPATLNRLFQDAMEAKHTLTARSRASIQINFQGRSSEVQVLRDQFEEMSADMLERTTYTSRQLIGAAGLTWKDVNRVLLVGGSSRMPMVPRMLKELTGIEPDRMVNPDEAVARGAAIYAGYVLSQREGRRGTFAVTDVNAHSLGIEGIDTDTLRKKNVILIPRNTALPVQHTERFSTKSEGQRSIGIKVLEGESSLPGECIAIGRTVVRDLPTGLPKGWPVEISFEYGTNGRLTVRAEVPGTQHRAALALERDVGITGEGISRWKATIDAAAGFSAFDAAAQDVLAATQRDPHGSSVGSGVGSGSSVGWALAGAAGNSAPIASGGSAPIALPPLKSAGADMAAPFPSPAAAQWASAPRSISADAAVANATAADATLVDATGVSLASPEPDPGVPAAEASTVNQANARPRARRKPLLPAWLSRMIGLVVSAGLGLLVGYLILNRVRPDLFKNLFR